MEALPEIEGAGARLVVVTPQSTSRASAWRDRIGLGRVLVIADPELTLFHALGARRPPALWALRPRVVLVALEALARREGVGLARGDDALQLGADVVVDGTGRIVLLHLAGNAADRVPPADLVAAVRELRPAPV